MNINELVEKGLFKEAMDKIDFSRFKVFYEHLLEGAFSDGNPIYYDFMKFLIETRRDSVELHYYTSELVTTALNFLPNGYEIAFEHAKQAIALAPDDWTLKEYILLFYDIPDKLLSRPLAKQYAEEILKVDKDNIAAKRVVGR